jgi:hypothetical protein
VVTVAHDGVLRVDELLQPFPERLPVVSLTSLMQDSESCRLSFGSPSP